MKPVEQNKVDPLVSPGGDNKERKRALSTEDIQAWLVAQLSEELHLEPEQIDVREPFAAYGLDSLRAVSISGDLGDWLGLRLPSTLAWDYPTIEALARHLAETLTGTNEQNSSGGSLDNTGS